MSVRPLHVGIEFMCLQKDIHIPVDLLVDGLDLVRLEWGLSYQQRVPVNNVMLDVRSRDDPL